MMKHNHETSKIPKGYKQTEVGVIPEDWMLKKLGDILDFIGAGKTNTQNTGSYPLYGSTGLIGLCKRPEYKGLAILVARVGANAGALNIVNGEYGVSDNTIILRLKEGNHVLFFKNILSMINLNSLVFGSGQPLITGSQLKNINVQYPSNIEQTAIANALSDVDALISELEKLIAKKEAIKTGAMQQLLTGRTRLPQFAKREDGTLKGYKQSELGEIPEDWEVVTTYKVSELLTGYPFASSKFSDNGIRLLRGSNVKRGETDWSEDISMYWESSLGLSEYELRDGDIVIAMDGSLVGRSFAQISSKDIPSLLVQRVARLRGTVIDQNYLKSWVCSPVFTSYCDSVKTVTAIPHISPQDIREFEICMPEIKQEQIAIAEILSDMDSEIEVLENRLEKTKAIKQGMMQELLTGRTRLV